MTKLDGGRYSFWNEKSRSQLCGDNNRFVVVKPHERPNPGQWFKFLKNNDDIWVQPQDNSNRFMSLENEGSNQLCELDVGT